MGLLATLHEARAHTMAPLTMSSPEIVKYLGSGASSSTGVVVSEDGALNYAPFWASVSLISSDVASLPLNLFQRLSNGGKKLYTDPKLYRVLHDEFNPEMGSMVAREAMQSHALTWGNAFAEIVRNGAGQVVQLWPLTPDRVAPFRQDRRLKYRLDGNAIYEASDILHVPGLGFDGIVGYSVVAKARESIGLGLATERFGGTFFGNGSTFGGVFQHPGKMTEPAMKNFRESLAARHAGVDRAHKFLVVEEGMTYQRLGIPPNDAQFLETRKFQIEEIARWFRLPPHKIGAMEHATFSNIEHQDLEYYKSCLRGWLVRWEQEIQRKLIAPSEQRIQFVKHNLDGLLRADIKTRYEAYAIARQWGWKSADDVLDKEDENPLPNGQGQIYLVPQNMWPADKINEMIAAQAAKGTSSSAPDQTPSPDPALKRTVDLLEGRCTAADACVAEVKIALETRERDVADLQQKVGTSEADRVRAVTELDAERARLAQLELLRAELQGERDTARQQLADQIEARRLEGVQAAEDRIRAEQAVAAAQVEATRQAQLATDAETRALEAHALADRRAADVEAAQSLLVEATAAKDVDAAARAEAERLVTAAQAEAAEARTQAAAATQSAQEAQSLADQATTAKAEALTALETLQARADALAAEERARTRERDEALAAAGRTAVELGEALATVADVDVKRQAEVEARAHAEATRDAHAAEVERLRQADAAGVAATIAAHRGLVKHVMGRMVVRETDRARMAQTTPEKLRKWVDTFYDSHEDLMRAALLPAVRVHLAFVRSVEDPIEATRRLVQSHVGESLRQIRLMLEGDADEIAASLPALLQRWDTERPSVIADALMQKELDYARRR